MIGTAMLSLPNDPRRRERQVRLLDARTVERTVAEYGGRVEREQLVRWLAGGRLSLGAADAAIRRAAVRGDVLLDGGDVVLPPSSESA